MYCSYSKPKRKEEASTGFGDNPQWLKTILLYKMKIISSGSKEGFDSAGSLQFLFIKAT